MKEIGFNLTKINTMQFAIIEDAYKNNVEEYDMDISLGYGLDTENAAILSSVKIQFTQNKIPFLIIEASCEFDITEKSWKIFSEKKQIIIPKEFMAHLAMITVGTTRGILHAKTKDTKFNSFILPTINVAKMLQEDGIFEK